MYKYQYARPSVTTTVALIDHFRTSILLGIRNHLTEEGKPNIYPGKLCMPGGFMHVRIDDGDCIDPPLDTAGETLEDCAAREVLEEVGVTIDKTRLQLVHVGSNPDPKIDHRAHIVNVLYMYYMTADEEAQINPGDDIVDTEWTTFINYISWTEDSYAFDHYDLIKLVSKKVNPRELI